MARRRSVVFPALLVFSFFCCCLPAAENGGSVSGGSLKFELFDVFGRKACSEDYAGVPVFLEFGACW
jgi:hypothetical protein